MQFVGPDGESLNIETKIPYRKFGRGKKGINMSRIIRIFTNIKMRFSPEILGKILRHYKKHLDSQEARIKADFSYPMVQQSLRGFEGYQYYGCSFEGLIDRADRVRKIIHFDFVYSSACPCASELSEHARESRDLLAIPHSQRSKARVNVEVHRTVSFHWNRDMCINGLSTETQVMVRREDEQAFAEMNELR